MTAGLHRIVLAVMLLTGASTGQAGAEETGQILILPFTSAPEIAADADLLVQVMTRTATDLGQEPLSAQASRSDIAVLSGCPADDTACYETIAETVGVDRVVIGSVESAPGGGLQVTMTLVEPGAEPRRRSAVLSAGGRQPLEQEFGAHARALLTGAPAPVAAPVVVDQTPAPGPMDAGSGFALSRVERYSWAVAGGGVALVGLGSVLLLSAQDKQDQVDGAATDTAADFDRLRDLEDSGKRLTRWGNVALIAGGLATVAGVALIIKQGGSSPEDPPAASIAPSPVAGGFGLTITLRGDL